MSDDREEEKLFPALRRARLEREAQQLASELRGLLERNQDATPCQHWGAWQLQLVTTRLVLALAERLLP